MSKALMSAIACGFLLPTLGCRATRTTATKEAIPASNANAEREMKELLLFRNFFHKLASEQGVTDADFQKIVLLPTPEMVSPPPAAVSASSAAEADKALLDQAKIWTAAGLYENSKNTAFDNSVDPEAVLRAKGPATLIVIPGIFGEFIDKYPLHETFDRPNSFDTAYARGLTSVTDNAYSLYDMNSVSFPLGERVHLGAIDGKDGKPLVQTIFLQAAFGSLETLGSNEDNAKIFLRRLNKIFTNAAGSPIPLDSAQNIYLVGYSQGTDVILDMAAIAQRDSNTYPFVKNLKGLITMSGVIYGTEVAQDAYYNPDSSTNKLLTQIQATLQTLRPQSKSATPGTSAPTNDSYIDSLGNVLSSWSELLSLAGRLSSIPPAPVADGQKLEGLTTAGMDPLATINLLTDVFSHLFAVGLSPQDAQNNITQLVNLLDHVMQGTRGLSTKARIEWWQTHTLPADLPIYSVATSMPDASSASSKSPLLDSPYFGSDMFDYQKVLRPGFYTLARISDTPLNDSQVVTVKERIYPALITKYNQNQVPFPTHNMGILGTHHWGHAFPAVLNTAGGATNPFPRRAFAEAMGAFVRSFD